MTSPVAKVIRGDEALAGFRAGLTGPYALELLAAAQWGVLVQLAVGVGKTEWMVKIIAHALETGTYDLVVVLVPRWDILKELLKRLPKMPRPVVLAPRPRKRCGDLDATWSQYETKGLGHLGRATLCANCPRRQGCSWPGQYGSRLRGAKLVLCTQQHLAINPLFVAHLQQHSRASSPLVLVDESTLLLQPLERTIKQADLGRFVAAQEARLSKVAEPNKSERLWLEHARLLAAATTDDLRGPGWRFPNVQPTWATEVQQEGLALFGEAFRFPGHELHHLARSDPDGRERLPGGDIRFVAPPYLGCKFVVFSGSIAPQLARYRVDPDHNRAGLAVPFSGYRFEHPETRWFNLNLLAGAASYFPTHAPRILDFFAAKVARNIEEGKRTLLVSRKRFRADCVRLLRDRLKTLDVGPVKLVTGDWDKHDLQDARTVAIITYGVAGLNRFQHVEAVYCLNGFYVPAEAVSRAVQEVEATDERFPLAILSAGRPRRRTVRVDLPDGRMPLLPFVAQQALQQKEADVVVQAVGRVRPFTRAREVVTFQADALPGVEYTLEFRSLKEARDYFGIQTPSQAGMASRAELARRLRAQGYTRLGIAGKMSVSLSTVKRYLRRG